MKSTLLVIDDCADTRKNISEILELADYNVFQATKGKEGLELARKHHPDLILCDIRMSELDGYGVLHAMQNNHELELTPFIFINGEEANNDFRNAMDSGADDYLTKPVSGDELLKVVSARLKKSLMIKKTFSKNKEMMNDFFDKTKSLNVKTVLSANHTIKKFKKKEIVFREDDDPEFLYFIMSGRVKAFKTNYWGKEFITDIYKEGDFFGYLALLDGNKHRATVEAIENSQIAFTHKQDFYDLIHSDNDISDAFIKMVSNGLQTAREKLMNFAYDSARKKVAEAIIFISEKYRITGSNELSFPVQRENISAIAGISHESVSRNLTDLRKEGLIKINNREIKIIDLKKLESLKW